MTDDDTKEAAVVLEPVPARTQEELTTFVRDYLAEKIFTSANIKPLNFDVLQMIFMPIALGGLQNIDTKTIGVIYEYLSEAGPRSINGYPCFFSLRLMNNEDWKRCFDAIVREQERKIEV